jgi:hypothetical protein
MFKLVHELAFDIHVSESCLTSPAIILKSVILPELEEQTIDERAHPFQLR